ncbi:DUF3656 domain-containing U32 family peptidase [Alkaliphilus transvaalensis]|uniref:DUF3656 domain-containing U32 family peptidase n=1 Tax=Alkaliphilus transvaalensis TaxID=114628 RepID=UPI00047C56B9|nr:U32 family peptidase [Alkaliphilus transvaalensis]
MKKIELLAPAGSFEALKAALQNGADAVYLGGTEFSARAYASNFDRKTLQEAVAYSHIRGMKVYVTINTLMKDHEIQGLLEYVDFLYNIDVDAVIVQDLGVLSLIRQAYPDFEIHCSTQMTLHNIEGVEILKAMGVHRVVLARELSIEAIEEIHEKTGMELEVFVHGALCVSYSGQCLMSSFIGGRSGNRGRCAQPCRKPYQIISANGKLKDPKNSYYHLSMRDLNTFDEIGKLIEGGVTSFKIEGRMKKPQYVASVVRSYRQGIDHYLSKNKSLRDEKIQLEMEKMFNRKFTKGYIFNSPKEEVVNIEKPNNRGIYLGEVKQYNSKNKRLQMKLKADLAVGDGIEVWQGQGSNEGGAVTAIYLNNKPVTRAIAGQVVEIDLKGKIYPGDGVYKTLDTEMMEELEKTYAHQVENKKIKIFGEIKVALGEEISLMLWDQDENYVYHKTDYIVEKAQKVALTKERLLENLRKLGNTPYSFENIEIKLEEGVAVPISVINGLRRDAIEKLDQLRENRHHRIEKESQPQLPVLSNRPLEEGENRSLIPKISVKVDTLHQLKVVLEAEVNIIYYGDIRTFAEATTLCHGKGVKIYFRTPAIMTNDDYKRFDKDASGLKPDGILAGDLGMVAYGNRMLKTSIMGDYSLNVMNSYTLNRLETLGLEGAILSPELDFKNIKGIKANPFMKLEAIIYGKMPVMTLEYCPLKQINECNHQCDSCATIPYQYRWGLKDQKQMTFPLGKDCWGRTIILNSQTLYMMDKLHDFKKHSLSIYRLEFTDEEAEEIRATLKHCQEQIKALNANKSPKGVEELKHLVRDGFTRGHYYRGVE